MCTTQSPQMLRAGALNPAGGRGPDLSRPRWSPASEDPAPAGYTPTWMEQFITGVKGQGGYKRVPIISRGANPLVTGQQGAGTNPVAVTGDPKSGAAAKTTNTATNASDAWRN